MNNLDDLISRAAARDVINTWGRHVNKDARMFLLHYDINAIPAVDAAPVVHGRWVSKNEEGIYGSTYCSICDFELRIDDMPYCPMCGAKMDGGDVDESK